VVCRKQQQQKQNSMLCSCCVQRNPAHDHSHSLHTASLSILSDCAVKLGSATSPLWHWKQVRMGRSPGLYVAPVHRAALWPAPVATSSREPGIGTHSVCNAERLRSVVRPRACTVAVVSAALMTPWWQL
jgi:hypothetical protein